MYLRCSQGILACWCIPRLLQQQASVEHFVLQDSGCKIYQLQRHPDIHRTCCASSWTQATLLLAMHIYVRMATMPCMQYVMMCGNHFLMLWCYTDCLGDYVIMNFTSVFSPIGWRFGAQTIKRENSSGQEKNGAIEDFLVAISLPTMVTGNCWLWNMSLFDAPMACIYRKNAAHLSVRKPTACLLWCPVPEDIGEKAEDRNTQTPVSFLYIYI